MPVSVKGSRRERELLEWFVRQGYVVHRIAGSGLGEDAVCDLIAIRNGIPHLIECKSRKNVYYSKDNKTQLKQLMRIADSCKAKALLAVKLNYKDWQFFDLLKDGIPEKVT